MFVCSFFFLFIYYESTKRKLKTKYICGCRCYERSQPKTKEFTRLSYTEGFWVPFLRQTCLWFIMKPALFDFYLFLIFFPLKIMVRWKCGSCSVQVDTKNKDNAKYCFQGFACGEKGEASEEVLCLSVFDFSWHFQSLPPPLHLAVIPPLSPPPLCLLSVTVSLRYGYLHLSLRPSSFLSHGYANAFCMYCSS